MDIDAEMIQNIAVNKRKLDESFDQPDQSENTVMMEQNIETQLSISNFDDTRMTKKLKTQSFKNSIQLLNEMQQIQPLSFTFASVLETIPKQTFTCCLSFLLNNNEFKFDANGSSKKQAKTLVSLKALYYLTENINIFGNLISDYYRTSINSELRSLNLSIDQIIVSNDSVETKIHSEQKDSSFELKQITNDVKTPTKSLETSSSSNSETPATEFLLQNQQLNNNINSYFFLKNDNKTKEILKTQNYSSILNYLMPNSLKFVDQSMDNVETETTKTFRIELIIRKDIASPKFVKNSMRIASPVQSIFVEENDEEFKFIGFGSSKKIAKCKAARIALEFLFSIKSDNDGMVNFYFKYTF